MCKSTQKQATVQFSGYVQGVGFRYTTLELSRHYQVTGYVKNLSDGSVECVAEGEEAEVGRFLDGIRASPLGRYIVGESLTWAPASDRFSRFSIAC